MAKCLRMFVPKSYHYTQIFGKTFSAVRQLLTQVRMAKEIKRSPAGSGDKPNGILDARSFSCTVSWHCPFADGNQPSADPKFSQHARKNLWDPG